MHVDTIYTNGRIRTMDPAHPRATRFAVLGGRIVALDDEVDGLRAHRMVDLQGAPVVPGFHDAHHHLALTGARLASVDVRPHTVGTVDELYARIREQADGRGRDEWIAASGYDQNVIGAHPTAEGLDAAADGRPVIVEHVSGHMIVASTAAFALAGYPGRVGVPDVAGGHVARTSDGRAAGLLQEQASSLIHELRRPVPLDEVQHHLDLASAHAARYGLTSLTDPGFGAWRLIGNSPVDLHSYQTAVETGRIRQRMTVMPHVDALHQIEGFRDGATWFGLDHGMRTGLGDEWLRIGPVKVIADGSLIGRSAAMRECYHGEPDNHGVQFHEPRRLQELIIACHSAGWTVATHAIGDDAIDQVLDAVSEAQHAVPRPGARHRIEHFALADDTRVARAAALGVIPVPQGTFLSDFGDGMAAAVGPEREEQIYRMRSLLDAGLVLPGSTDSPVSDGNPIRSIHDMVNRVTASGRVLGARERLTVEQAVHAYTVGSAYAAGADHERGKLAPGLLADFTVLSDDLFAVAPERIADVTVVATVVGDRPTFDDGVCE